MPRTLKIPRECSPLSGRRREGPGLSIFDFGFPIFDWALAFTESNVLFNRKSKIANRKSEINVLSW
jgi:hypothetical protein